MSTCAFLRLQKISPVEQFVSQLSVEAFAVAVLPATVGLDLERLGAWRTPSPLRSAHQPLQPGVLLLQILHPPRLIEVKTSALFAPTIKTLLRDPGFPARNLGRFPLAYRKLTLAKQRHNLLRAEPLPLGITKLLSKTVSNKPLGSKRASHVTLVWIKL